MNESAINELRAQRNQALDMLANAAGVIADLQKQIVELKAQFEESKAA